MKRSAWIVGVVTGPAVLRKFYRLDPKRRPADMIELRLDLIPGRFHEACLEMAEKLEKSGVPVIATFRLEAEGGKWKGGDAKRLLSFKNALRTVSWVDIELRSEILKKVLRLVHVRGKKAVVSHHDFLKTPPLNDLWEIVEQSSRVGADIVKIATKVCNSMEARTLRALLVKSGKIQRFPPICLIGMSKWGRPLRILLPRLGSKLAYGWLDRPVAPGQLSCWELFARLKK